jgi:hypothetical protein
VRSRVLRVPLAMVLAVACIGPATVLLSAQTDLDAFMKKVLERRDDNWKKLQQYVLDERERIELRGPSKQPIWGEHREYTWYIRDGYFVRSPLKFNGVTISEDERRKFEADYLKRQKDREKRGQRGESSIGSGGVTVQPGEDPPSGADALTVDGLIRQTRQPQFISSAYFLRFKFEQGKYALVGREKLDDRDVLRIEYYPTRLYSNDQRRRQATSHDKDDPYDKAMQRALNKVALITLWVEPSAHQIVKYTFDNVGFDFLPGQWFVHVTDLKASMTMGQPFPDVWLPKNLEMLIGATLALGPFDVRYALDYHDYRQPDVKTKIKVGGVR